MPDGNFISGGPTGEVGHTFEVTFHGPFLANHPMPANVYPYFCGLHWEDGQVGTIVVKPHPCAVFDSDDDYDVDLTDLALLLGHYGMTSGAEYEDGDLDGDGDVDLTDLAELLGRYGTACE